MTTTYTPKFGVPQQSNSAVDGPSMAEFNAAFLALDQQASKDRHGSGLGTRGAAGIAGVYFTDDTTGITYRDNGSAWVVVGASVINARATNDATGSIVSVVTAIASS